MGKSWPPKLTDRAVAVISKVATLLGIATYVLFALNCTIGPWHQAAVRSDRAAASSWVLGDSTVVSVGNILTDQAGRAIDRPATLRYEDFYGRSHLTPEMLMPWQDTVGSQEPVMVGKDGQSLFIDNQANQYSDPRPDNVGGLIVTGWLYGIVIATLCWFVIYGALAGAYLVATRVKRNRSIPGSILLWIAARQAYRVLLRVRDLARLVLALVARWRNRLPTSVYYHTLLKLQQELSRLDPTPTVIAARQRVEQIKAQVLERDDLRGKEILGLLDGIEKDVAPELRARALVAAEQADNHE